MGLFREALQTGVWKYRFLIFVHVKENILKNDDVSIILWFALPSILHTNPKWPVIVGFLISWRKTFDAFSDRVKLTLSNSPVLVWTFNITMRKQLKFRTVISCFLHYNNKSLIHVTLLCFNLISLNRSLTVTWSPVNKISSLRPCTQIALIVKHCHWSIGFYGHQTACSRRTSLRRNKTWLRRRWQL